MTFKFALLLFAWLGHLQYGYACNNNVKTVLGGESWSWKVDSLYTLKGQCVSAGAWWGYWDWIWINEGDTIFLELEDTDSIAPEDMWLRIYRYHWEDNYKEHTEKDIDLGHRNGVSLSHRNVSRSAYYRMSLKCINSSRDCDVNVRYYVIFRRCRAGTEETSNSAIPSIYGSTIFRDTMKHVGCRPCEAGKICATDSCKSCTSCNSNQITNDKKTMCIDCLEHEVPNAAKDSCKCEGNFNRSSTGNCDVCLPGYFLESNCVCEAIHNNLPTNYLDRRTCNSCEGNFDISSKCTTCITSWNSKMTHYSFEEDTSCRTCKPGYDFSTKCTTCLDGYTLYNGECIKWCHVPGTECSEFGSMDSNTTCDDYCTCRCKLPPASVQDGQWVNDAQCSGGKCKRSTCSSFKLPGYEPNNCSNQKCSDEGSIIKSCEDYGMCVCKPGYFGPTCSELCAGLEVCGSSA